MIDLGLSTFQLSNIQSQIISTTTLNILSLIRVGKRFSVSIQLIGIGRLGLTGITWLTHHCW